MFDATDAEISRREHAAEMGEDSESDKAWYAYIAECERLLGVDTLDGDDSEDGYSLDSAMDAFDAGIPAETYILQVKCRQIVG